MSKLSGKTALVTGASRGIGRAIAERLASDGALVAVHYGGNEAAALETVAAIESKGGRAFTVQARLGVEGDVDTLVDGLVSELGSPELDIIVNNAATLGDTRLADSTPEYFEKIFAVNVKAPFFLVQRLLPHLRDNGRIINISSAVVRIALPEIAYAMTKGALDVFGRTLANDLSVGSRGITVNTVAPGPTDTGHPMFQLPELVEGMKSTTALNRVGHPEDIADTVALLASPDAGWITGNLIDATGGMYLGPKM
ncbi:short-chain dehydrogenase [Actinorhabdospora filicis]|uniref:Short-chain dehydrogenase n=1 Tax=Actinorhabdospora filicis TaxID=1785913 RepID=A0A9W6SKE5_9ACTN|nr:SDR family oxidoreductase [Actinorhabdospora filicis]GLZ77535.1 short-chain dehydrogenase [Actinorhabdospora filicis]